MTNRVCQIVAILITSLFTGCFYDKADQVYPGGNCDTTLVRYSVEINTILNASCKSCHDGSNSISGIDLYDHKTIQGLALDGKYTYGTLLSAVMHQGGASPMPQGDPKLPECDINKMAAWVHRGAPDN